MPRNVLADIDHERAAIESRLKELNEREMHVIRGKRFTCVYCGKTSALGKCGFVQGHWYESPHGCMGGDHWFDDKIETCHIVCAKCRMMNYIYNHPAKDTILELEKRLSSRFTCIFKHVWDQYGDQKPKLRESKP
jgi:hypothetical protein